MTDTGYTGSLGHAATTASSLQHSPSCTGEASDNLTSDYRYVLEIFPICRHVCDCYSEVYFEFSLQYYCPVHIAPLLTRSAECGQDSGSLGQSVLSSVSFSAQAGNSKSDAGAGCPYSVLDTLRQSVFNIKWRRIPVG